MLAVLLDTIRRSIVERRCRPEDREKVVRLFNAYNTDVENLMKGAAKLVGEVGGTYEGERNAMGQQHGQGTYRYTAGDVYTGGWKEGRRDGYGTYQFASSDVYEGEWVPVGFCVFPSFAVFRPSSLSGRG